MEQDVKKLVEKTEEDEKTYKRVAEERKQLEEKVALLQVSEENRLELKRVQFCLSQPTFYTNPSKMEELIRRVEELIRKVEEVEKQYAMESGSPISTPLARQPSDGCMIANLHGSMSAQHVTTGGSGAESGMESVPWLTKSHTLDFAEDFAEEPQRSVIPSCINNTQTVQPIMLPTPGPIGGPSGFPSPVSKPKLRESSLNSSSHNGFQGIPTKKTDGKTSPLWQSYNSNNGNENEC